MLNATEAKAKSETNNARLKAEREAKRAAAKAAFLEENKELIEESLLYIEDLILEQCENGEKNIIIHSASDFDGIIWGHSCPRRRQHSESEFDQLSIEYKEPWLRNQIKNILESQRMYDDRVFEAVLEIIKESGYNVGYARRDETVISW